MPPSEFAQPLAVVVAAYCVVYGLIVSEGVCICLHGMDVRGLETSGVVLPLGSFYGLFSILFRVLPHRMGRKIACLAFSLHPFSVSAISDGAPAKTVQICHIHLRFQTNPMESKTTAPHYQQLLAMINS